MSTFRSLASPVWGWWEAMGYTFQAQVMVSVVVFIAVMVVIFTVEVEPE